MPRNLPTLKGLRAFEEAFTLSSFTAAAKKLNVQQPAISYQIKRLEEDLGTKLFVKEHGRLQPTPEAKELFEIVSNAFDAVRRVSEKLRSAAADKTCSIATYPGIGTYWLSSKLPILSEKLASPIKVTTLLRDADILNEPADCLILFGDGNWLGFESYLLMREKVCPVASPDLATKILESAKCSHSTEIPIIEQEDPEERWLSWDKWSRQTQDLRLTSANRMKVNDHGFALHLALAGVGATLAWTDVVEDILAGGGLVPLSDKIATSQAGYWLVARPGFFETIRGQTILKSLRKNVEAPDD